VSEITRVPPRSLPVTTDHDTKGFFEAAARGELAVQVCAACATVLHAPVAYCAGCGSWDTAWRVVAGTGTLYSWTVVEHQTHPAFPVPFTVVLVALDDVPARLVGHLPGRPALAAGQAMRVRFDHRDDGTIVPDWDIA
jgi:uncharacterized OB-fold protein